MLTCCAVRILLPHGSGNDISKNKPSSKIEGSDFRTVNCEPSVQAEKELDIKGIARSIEGYAR